MILFPVVASALQAPSDLLFGRPLSWDAIGFVPIEPYAKITPEGRQLLEKLRDGNTEMVAAKSIALIKKDPNDGFAGWLYVQCAKIRKNPTAALAEWDKATPKRTWATEQAAVKLTNLAKLKFFHEHPNEILYYPTEPEAVAVSRATLAVKQYPNSLPVLLAAYDVLLDHDAMRKRMITYTNSHPEDFFGRLILGQSYLFGGTYISKDDGKPVPEALFPEAPQPKKASGILEECLKERPTDPGTQYLTAVARVLTQKEDSGFELFATLLKNDKAPIPMLDRVRVAYERRSIQFLRRNPDE